VADSDRPFAGHVAGVVGITCSTSGAPGSKGCRCKLHGLGSKSPWANLRIEGLKVAEKTAGFWGVWPQHVA